MLTKPLGTGIVTTGCKAGVAPPGSVETAVETMATLNRTASEAMMEVGVNACTDVTGFGLMGHLTGMLRASGVSAEISASKAPVLPGVDELLAQGVAPGGTHRNQAGVEDYVDWDDTVSENDRLLLCDAQTSGGASHIGARGKAARAAGRPGGAGRGNPRRNRQHRRWRPRNGARNCIKFPPT